MKKGMIPVRCIEDLEDAIERFQQQGYLVYLSKDNKNLIIERD